MRWHVQTRPFDSEEETVQKWLAKPSDVAPLQPKAFTVSKDKNLNKYKLDLVSSKIIHPSHVTIECHRRYTMPPKATQTEIKMILDNSTPRVLLTHVDQDGRRVGPPQRLDMSMCFSDRQMKTFITKLSTTVSTNDVLINKVNVVAPHK
jgi:hypothetical protein